MKHTFLNYIGKKHNLFAYSANHTESATRLRNRVLFLQRNIMTGLKKDFSSRHPKEQEAIDTVFRGLIAHNHRAEAARTAFLHSKEYLSMDVAVQEEAKKAFFKKHQVYPYPTAEKWFLSSFAMTTILQETGDADYYALPAQVNQRVVAKACDAMKSFFSSIKTWKKMPSAFKGMPQLPKYLKCRHSVVSFSNQVCKIREENGYQYLTFPKTGEVMKLGYMNLKGKLQSVEIVPYGNGYQICITTEDGIKEEEILPKNNRMYAMDLGVDNFVMVTGNFEMQPFILDGRFLKAVNQLYNKVMAKLHSCMMKGRKTTKGIHVEETKAMKQQTAKRDRQLRDAFYKMAHFLCRKAISDKVDTIVFGWNKNIKHETHIGDANTQNFVQLPYRKFFAILQCVAYRYGIAVVEQEESYTSGASFLDGDYIPTYGVDDDKADFHGSRIKRGIYRSDNGTVLNADVNGSLNILKKYKTDAFKDMKDFQCFVKYPKRYGFDTFYSKASKNKPSNKKGIVHQAHRGSCVLPVPSVAQTKEAPTSNEAGAEALAC